MDSSRFMKLCKDTGLIDDKILKQHDVDIIFTKTKDIDKRKMSYEAFKKAMSLIATRKGVSSSQLSQFLLDSAATGPSFSGTMPQENRLYDDRSLYTGVWRKGGPTIIDLDRQDFSRLLNRVPANVRGIKQEQLDAFERPVLAGKYPHPQEMESDERLRRPQSADRTSRSSRDTGRKSHVNRDLPNSPRNSSRLCQRNAPPTSSYSSSPPRTYSESTRYENDNFGPPPPPPPSSSARYFRGFDYGYHDAARIEQFTHDRGFANEHYDDEYGAAPLQFSHSGAEYDDDNENGQIDPKEWLNPEPATTAASAASFYPWSTSSTKPKGPLQVQGSGRSTPSQSQSQSQAHGEVFERHTRPPLYSPAHSRLPTQSNSKGQGQEQGQQRYQTSTPLSVEKPLIRPQSAGSIRSKKSDSSSRENIDPGFANANANANAVGPYDKDPDSSYYYQQSTRKPSRAPASYEEAYSSYGHMSDRGLGKSHSAQVNGGSFRHDGDRYDDDNDADNDYGGTRYVDDGDEEEYHNKYVSNENMYSQYQGTRLSHRPTSVSGGRGGGGSGSGSGSGARDIRRDESLTPSYGQQADTGRDAYGESMGYSNGSSDQWARPRRHEGPTSTPTTTTTPQSVTREHNKALEADLESAVHKMYISYSNAINEEMDSAKFVKLCRDAGLIGATLTVTDADLIFQRAKKGGNYGKRMTYHEFRLVAVPMIAERRLVSVEEVMGIIANNAGPSSTRATTPSYVRLHDDPATYTGVYGAGGPTTVDRDNRNGSYYLDRSESDVRGVALNPQRRKHMY